jgi:hypothetical protein
MRGPHGTIPERAATQTTKTFHLHHQLLPKPGAVVVMKTLLKPVSLAATTVTRHLRPGISNAASKEILARASKLLLQSTHKSMQNGRGLSAGSIGGQRSIVTDATLKKLKKSIPDNISFKETPPYQAPGLCERQTNLILKELQKSKGSNRSANSENKGFTTELFASWVRIFTGDFKTTSISKASDLLQVYKKNGPYGLRAPGIGERYDDHSVAVFAAVEIQTEKGKKTVLGVFDCNDLGTDPETTASRETAARIGKTHVSDLSHAEANQNGAEGRRIRFLDVDGAYAHMMEYCKHHAALGHLDRDPQSLSEGPNVYYPSITHLKDGIQPLSPKDEQDLRTLLEEIYESEVEKFENMDYSQLVHKKNISDIRK